ncbi:MAG: ATP synthase F1 subunit epsilon [Acidimicrobiales bacterium]
MPFDVQLVSPERLVFSGEADMVIARTTNGDIGFQPGHIPFVGVLTPERLKINLSDGTTREVAVHSGFVEVSADHVTVLSDIAEMAEDIDVARAQAALGRAEAALASDSSDVKAKAARRRAQVRIQVAETVSGAAH